MQRKVMKEYVCNQTVFKIKILWSNVTDLCNNKQKHKFYDSYIIPSRKQITPVMGRQIEGMTSELRQMQLEPSQQAHRVLAGSHIIG